MTEAHLVSEAERIVAQAVMFPIVFVHVGALDSRARLVDLIATAMERRGQLSDVHSLRSGAPARGGVVVGFDAISSSENRCERLSQLRSRVMELVADQHRFVLVSEVPKLALADCRGSQLILDARTIYLSAVGSEGIGQLLIERELEPADARWQTSLSLERTALLPSVLDLRAEDGESNKAHRRRVRGEAVNSLVGALSETGPASCAALQDELRLASADSIEDRVAPLVLECWRSIGILRPEIGDVPAVLARPDLLKEAVAEAIDRRVLPPAEIGEIFVGLWEIERRLRRRLQVLAQEKHAANWKLRVVAHSPDLASRVLMRAESERTERLESVSLLDNPLEWMTLDELFDLVEQQNEWACPPETPPLFFRRMKTALQPIRNRVAHFRLAQHGDTQTVATYLARVRTQIVET